MYCTNTQIVYVSPLLLNTEYTEKSRSCHILYQALSWRDHRLFYLTIIRKYKVTLCLKDKSENSIICNVCYRWWHAALTVNSMQKLATSAQNRCTYSTKWPGFIAKISGFCLISQGILNTCVASILYLIVHILQLIEQLYNCSRGNCVFIQSSDSSDWQSFKQVNERERKEEDGCLVSSLFASMASGWKTSQQRHKSKEVEWIQIKGRQKKFLDH